MVDNLFQIGLDGLMREGGWSELLCTRPLHGRLLQLRRPGWRRPLLVVSGSDEFNIHASAGRAFLFWRYTGIGLEMPTPIDRPPHWTETPVNA